MCWCVWLMCMCACMCVHVCVLANMSVGLSVIKLKEFQFVLFVCSVIKQTNNPNWNSYEFQ